jgi:hypothetical protein
VAKADANLSWLSFDVIVLRVARRFGWTVEYARSQIVPEEGVAGQGRACGPSSDGWPASPLPAFWRGIEKARSQIVQELEELEAGRWDADGSALVVALVDLRLDVLIAAQARLDAIVARVDLRIDGLVAAHLLPAQPARWPADLALAYIIEGQPREREEWSEEMLRQEERAGIALAEAFGTDQVPAYGPSGQIPADAFRVERVFSPAPAMPRPNLVVRFDGTLGVLPAQRSVDYKGAVLSSIECDPARLIKAFLKPLRVERWMLHEAEQLYDRPVVLHTEESILEPAMAVEPMPPESAAPAEQASTVERRTRADKRRAVAQLLEDPAWECQSHRKIAKEVGVDPKTVSSVRKGPRGEIPTQGEEILTQGEEILTQGEEILTQGEEILTEAESHGKPASPAELKQPTRKKAAKRRRRPVAKKTAKRRRRPGPRRGTIDRFAQDDRALFPDATALIKDHSISAGEAAERLKDKIKGRGTKNSKLRRFANRYRAEVEKPAATRRSKN